MNVPSVETLKAHLDAFELGETTWEYCDACRCDFHQWLDAQMDARWPMSPIPDDDPLTQEWMDDAVALYVLERQS